MINTYCGLIHLVPISFFFHEKSSGQRAEKELTLETSDLLYGGNLPLLDCFDAKFSSNTSNSGMLAN